MVILLGLTGLVAAEWKQAVPGWTYAFPRDHGPHSGFKTEWWYFTGNLDTEDGNRFGYQLVFFRQETAPPNEWPDNTSRFVTDEIKLAHFALSDVNGKKFYFAQKLGRGAYGEAGFLIPSPQNACFAWNEDWRGSLNPDGSFDLKARMKDCVLDLTLHPAKVAIFHGTDGVSQKSRETSDASHYYSFTQLKTSGNITVGGRTSKVQGLSWFDREWASNQLSANVEGWDWFSLQFEDNTELMVFQTRNKTGGRYCAGTLIRADGSSLTLSDTDIALQPVNHWKSRATGAVYPVEWRIKIASLKMDLHVSTPLETQELNLTPTPYWEGCVDVSGSKKGRGYLEMTGYNDALPASLFRSGR